MYQNLNKRMNDLNELLQLQAKQNNKFMSNFLETFHKGNYSVNLKSSKILVDAEKCTLRHSLTAKRHEFLI